MTYGDVVAWIGSENLFYDRGREMYVVAVSASFEPRLDPVQEPDAKTVVCNSYFMVMDATDGSVLSVGCGGPTPWPPKLPSVFASAPTSELISGVLTRADAIAKAPLPLGDTVTRIEAKLVLRTDLDQAGNGIGGIGNADYVWVVARWGQFAAYRFGRALGATPQERPAPPEGWRVLLIDARTGNAYVGGESMAEATWWTSLRDRSGDLIR